MATKKPSSMKRTGKATAKPRAKAVKAASKFGGGLKKVVGAVAKRRAANKKALKGY
jgi:hypothetical protein